MLTRYRSGDDGRDPPNLYIAGALPSLCAFVCVCVLASLTTAVTPHPIPLYIAVADDSGAVVPSFDLIDRLEADDEGMLTLDAG